MEQKQTTFRGMTDIVTLVAAAVCFQLVTSRPAQADKVSIMGMGTGLCSGWNRSRKDAYSNLALMKQDWVLGYLSGISVGENADLLKYPEAVDIFKAIDRQCELKPSEEIFKAANSVARELEK